MKVIILSIVMISAMFVTGNAHADAFFGVNLDWNKFKDSSRGDWGVGARVGFGGGGVHAVTSFDYYFVDTGTFLDEDANPDNDFDLKFWELNENITYSFPTTARPYFGAGINYSRRNFNDVFSGFFDNTKNRVGFNVLGGFKFGTTVTPFIEARGTFYSGEAFNDRFVVSGGVLF